MTKNPASHCVPKDRKVHDVLELYRNLFLEDLVSNTEVKIRNSAFKFILNGGSLNCYPVIRGIAISRLDPSRTSLPTFSLRRRPIYLLSIVELNGTLVLLNCR